MIRPFTCLCLLLAGGSGLYLYQEKHRTQLLDREIGRVMRETQETRGRIGSLQAEWAVRTEPGRLADLATRFLALKPMAPTQFVQLADLAGHLPAVGPMPAAASAPAEDEAAPLPLAARPADQAGAVASADADADDDAPGSPPGAPKAVPAASEAAANGVAANGVAANGVAGAQDVGDDAPAPAAMPIKPPAKPAAHPRRPADAQLARAIDAGRPTTAQAHGGLLPLALPRLAGLRLLQAAARPGGTRATTLPRTLQPQGGAFIGSSLGGAASLPPAVPYTGE